MILIFGCFFSGPSRSTQTITTTTTTVTSTTTTRRKSKIVKRKKAKKRRRKVQRKRRTYVVEYDVDEYNNKFGIKTANRVIRKRRRKTKKSKRGGCARRKTIQNRSGSPTAIAGGGGGVASKGLRKEYPTLHLFGNKNALEYFSDASDNDEGIDSLNNSIETGDGLLIMSTARSSGHRNLIRRKNVAINSTIEAAETGGGIDILDNIMDTMNRWHTISRPSTIEKIRINADGSLECDAKPPARRPETTVQPNADIQNAPMNPRNDGSNGNRNFNNSNGFQGNNANQNAGNNRFDRRNEPISFNLFQRAGGSGNNSSGGNFNDGGFAHNFQNDNYSPRNRIPFQRQRNNLNNITSRLARNQMQSLPQLYDGEDILPAVPNVPTQCK